MDQLTGSVSGRGGWEWNRLQARDGLDEAASTPRCDPQQRIEQLEQGVARLRQELDRRERQQATIIRQYERNRELADQQPAESLAESLLSTLW